MIQRVQSIYLLLVTVVLSFVLVRPYADTSLTDSRELQFKAHAITIQSGEETVSVYKSTIPVVLLIVVSGLLSFVTIFLYTHRILQIRLTFLNMILIIVLIGTMLSYYLSVQHGNATDESNFRLGMAFPFLALVFSTMAIRSIRHDELLVKSYDRIR